MPGHQHGLQAGAVLSRGAEVLEERVQDLGLQRRPDGRQAAGLRLGGGARAPTLTTVQPKTEIIL